MRILKQKILINLIIGLIRFITILKRSIVFLFLVFVNFLAKITRLVLKPVALFLYKTIYFPIKKRILALLKESSKNKFFFLLSHSKSTNVLIAALTIFITFTNISAQNKEQDLNQNNTPSYLTDGEENIIEEAILEESTPLANYLDSAGVIKPSMSMESSDGQEEEPNLVCFFDNSFLFKPFTSVTYQTPRQRTKIESYIVQVGDTISDIAEKFSLNVITILWENNLSSYSIIKPGQTLSILPVNGITHKIAKGDTLDSIAKKYKVKKEDIMEFNKLASEKNLEKGLALVIPNGQKYVAPTIKKTIPQQAYQLVKGIFKSHLFPWGQCTWYVAQRRLVPWSGHAKNWLANARAYGYQIGKAPAKGAIVSLKEPSWLARLYGHVAYVEEVVGGQIVISEMNYRGKGVYSKRTLPVNDKRIIGYIY